MRHGEILGMHCIEKRQRVYGGLWCGLSLNVDNGWVGLGLHYSEKGAQRVEMWA